MEIFLLRFTHCRPQFLYLQKYLIFTSCKDFVYGEIFSLYKEITLFPLFSILL